MSTFHGNLSPGQQDKSDVLSLLLSIEGIYMACQNVLNTYTQTVLMLSVTIEAQMLLMKLRVMEDRWRFHLPFKEGCSVDFYDWGKKVEDMGQSLAGFNKDGHKDRVLPEFCPSKHFLLDLYEMLPDESSFLSFDKPYYSVPNISSLIDGQDKIRLQLTKHWKTYKAKFSDLIACKVDERIGEVLHPLSEKGVVIRMACCEVLQQLATELYRLDEMPSGRISPTLFARLAERVLTEEGYNGQKAQKAARRYVDNLRNTTPEEEWNERREEAISASVSLINEMKYGRKVSSYLAKSHNLKGHYAGFGRFLHSFRGEITKEELYELMVQLYRIFYLNEDADQQESPDPVDTADVAQHPPKDAQSVFRKRLSVTPTRPKLPIFFSEALAVNPQGVDMFYDTLHHCGFFIGRTLLPDEKENPQKKCYDGWKWKHVREALIHLKFVRPDSPKKGLAEYLAEVFPYLSATSVKRSFNSRGIYEDPLVFKRKVDEIIAEFKHIEAFIME